MRNKRFVKGFATLGSAAIVSAVPLLLDSQYWTSALTVVAINVLLTASLRTVTLIGEFSLGHVGFMLVGAYTAGLLALEAGLPFGLTVPAGALLAGFLALALGYPFMRVKGIYFAILTVVTSESLRVLAWNWESLTGGSQGLVGIPEPGTLSLPGWGEVNFGDFLAYYYLVVILVAICLAVLYLLENSRLGFTWLAIRESDRLAGSVGINVSRYKMICFSTASFFAGLGGALIAYQEQAISADPHATFGVMRTIYLLVYMVVGGERHFAGPIVGAILLSLVAEFTRSVQHYQPLIIGFIALVVVLFMRQGLVFLPSRILAFWSVSFAGRATRKERGVDR
ncbi:MAG: branched-chain amino acid ABC transporter permease [Deltaproteobacteria bacterium]|nr:branched-chain amino acid ABC transporter permease [Deltaproteobacteria bacterium]